MSDEPIDPKTNVSVHNDLLLRALMFAAEGYNGERLMEKIWDMLTPEHRAELEQKVFERALAKVDSAVGNAMLGDWKGKRDPIFVRAFGGVVAKVQEAAEALLPEVLTSIQFRQRFEAWLINEIENHRREFAEAGVKLLLRTWSEKSNDEKGQK